MLATVTSILPHIGPPTSSMHDSVIHPLTQVLAYIFTVRGLCKHAVQACRKPQGAVDKYLIDAVSLITFRLNLPTA